MDIDFKYITDKLDRKIRKKIENTPLEVEGTIVRSVGLTLEAKGFRANVGDLCYIKSSTGKNIKAVVTGFCEEKVYLMAIDNTSSIESNSKVILLNKTISAEVGDELLGRIIDGAGRPIDNKGKLNCGETMSLIGEPHNPLERKMITSPLDLGVKAINSFIRVGKGQKIGLFAGSGVGKSVLLGMISRFTEAEIVVVGLIGERGREVKEFIEHNLGKQGLDKSIIVASPADYSPVLRLHGAYRAIAIAEYFRNKGKDVLLLMDSLTRFSQAQREVALSMGEPPATKGYPPSVFSLLPNLVERLGMGTTQTGGSITGIFTVLAEADDHNDPIVDAARAILDGHIVLTRKLADLSHYPAIDISSSVSRVMTQIISSEELKKINKFKKFYSIYNENVDLINIGAYTKGTNAELDYAIENISKFKEYLTQGVNEKFSIKESIDNLQSIVK